MDESRSVKLIGAGVVIALVWFILIAPHTYTWDGAGSVSLFPSSDSVKNYRLDAQIVVTRHKHGWFTSYDEYSVKQADWPDGGTSYFDGCSMRVGMQTSCDEQDGHSYNVEVTQAPEQPEADSNDYNS